MQTDIHFWSYLAHFFLEWKIFQTKVVKKIKTHIFLLSNFFVSENRTVYEIMWENMVEWGRPQKTIWRTRIACWIQKTTNTHSEYVTLISLPLQQWLHKCASVPHYTVHCPSFYPPMYTWSSKYSLDVKYPHHNVVCSSPLLSPHALYQTNKIWCRVQTRDKWVCGSLSPRHGASSSCNWRNGLQYSG